MDIVSLILIAALIIFAVVGYIKGFFGIILNICKGLASLLISFFLAKPFGQYLSNLGLGNAIGNKLEQWIIKIAPISNNVISSDDPSGVLRETLRSANIPEFLDGIIEKLVGNQLAENAGERLSHYVSFALAILACTIIAFLILTIVVNIIFFLLRKFLNKINNIPVLGKINKVLGLLVNVVFGWAIISLILWGLSFVAVIAPGLQEYTNEWFKLDEETMTVAKWFYQNNIFIKIFETILEKL